MLKIITAVRVKLSKVPTQARWRSEQKGLDEVCNRALTPCLWTAMQIIAFNTVPYNQTHNHLSLKFSCIAIRYLEKASARFTKLCKCSVAKVLILYLAIGPGSTNCLCLTSRNLLHYKSKQASFCSSIQIGLGKFPSQKKAKTFYPETASGNGKSSWAIIWLLWHEGHLFVL